MLCVGVLQGCTCRECLNVGGTHALELSQPPPPPPLLSSLPLSRSAPYSLFPPHVEEFCSMCLRAKTTVSLDRTIKLPFIQPPSSGFWPILHWEAAPTSSPSWASFQCPLNQFSTACHSSLTREGKGFKIHLKSHLIFPVLNLLSTVGAGFIKQQFDFWFSVSTLIWASKKKALNVKLYFCNGSVLLMVCGGNVFFYHLKRIFVYLVHWLHETTIMCQGFVCINSVHLSTNYRLFSR